MDKPVRGYDELADVWGDPQYCQGVPFYPIKLVDSDYYNRLSILRLNKNVSGDPELIRMPFLKFILLFNKEYEGNEENYLANSLKTLLEYIFQDTVEFYYSLDVKFPKEPYEEFNLLYIQSEEDRKKLRFFIKIKDVFIADSTFNNIRHSIFLQNCIPIDKLGVTDPVLYEKLENAREKRFAKSNVAGLDEQIISLHVLTGVSIAEIKTYTFYQFMKALERAQMILDYKTLYPLEQKGEISFKDPKDSIKHWLDHVEPKGLYDDVIIEAQPVLQKLQKDLSGK